MEDNAYCSSARKCHDDHEVRVVYRFQQTIQSMNMSLFTDEILTSPLSLSPLKHTPLPLNKYSVITAPVEHVQVLRQTMSLV